MTIFPVFYLGPIGYYSTLLQTSSVLYEIEEHFIKQTFRNRCTIYGANGKLNLVIPVKHSGERTKVKDIMIANEVGWQKNHWRSMQAAYRSSGYFEFYEHLFTPFYEKNFNYLLDFNLALYECILKILDLPLRTASQSKEDGNFLFEKYPCFAMTKNYEREKPGKNDMRIFFPTHNNSKKVQVDPYTQVFSNKFGFIPGLSIVDLIFNEGPSANDYLKNQLI